MSLGSEIIRGGVTDPVLCSAVREGEQAGGGGAAGRLDQHSFRQGGHQLPLWNKGGGGCLHPEGYILMVTSCYILMVTSCYILMVTSLVWKLLIYTLLLIERTDTWSYTITICIHQQMTSNQNMFLFSSECFVSVDS